MFHIQILHMATIMNLSFSKILYPRGQDWITGSPMGEKTEVLMEQSVCHNRDPKV